jgi:hypothetical protein
MAGAVSITADSVAAINVLVIFILASLLRIPQLAE